MFKFTNWNAHIHREENHCSFERAPKLFKWNERKKKKKKEKNFNEIIVRCSRIECLWNMLIALWPEFEHGELKKAPAAMQSENRQRIQVLYSL